MGPRMYEGGWGHAGGHGGWVGALVLGLLLILLVAAVVILLLRATRHGHASLAHGHGHGATPNTDPAVTTLRERFARGEIDESEYTSRLALLNPAPPL